MRRLCYLGFFISVFFILSSFKPSLVNACEWQDTEYGRACGGNCPSGYHCTNSSGYCVCRYGSAPTNTPKPKATSTPKPGDAGGSCSGAGSCKCPLGGNPWCDDGTCRCDISYVTPSPRATKATCVWGACHMSNSVCGRTAYCGGAYYDYQICSKGACGGGGSSNTPTPKPNAPTPYPTSVVSGNLYLKNAGACSVYPNAGVTPAIDFIAQSQNGIQTNCTTNLTNATYSCNVNYDNTYIVPPLSQNFTLSSTSQTYGTGSWHLNNLCEGTVNNTRTIASGETYSGWNIFYKIIPWFKIQNGAFTSGTLGFSIPDTVTKFDSSDLGNRYLADGESGIITTSSTFGSSTSFPISSKSWSKENYSYTQLMTPSNWLSYIKSRKKFTAITSLSDITSDGIYYYNGDLSIDKTPDFNTVLVVSGTTTITDNLTQSSAFALISTGQISVSSSVNQINGVFIGSAFDAGAASTGLKVVGNISASVLNNDRDLTDNSKPSIFILFDPQTYIKLLPYLSVSKYDWRQIQ